LQGYEQKISSQERELLQMMEAYPGPAGRRSSTLAQLGGKRAFEELSRNNEDSGHQPGRGRGRSSDEEPVSVLQSATDLEQAQLQQALHEAYQDAGGFSDCSLDFDKSIRRKGSQDSKVSLNASLIDDKQSEHVTANKVLNLAIDKISKVLEELQGPLEPDNEGDKDQGEDERNILYSGPIHRYNYGFKNDFTERHLVLTMDSLKYYRSSLHAQNKKANNIPIVTVPMGLVESIKEFKSSSKEFSNLASNFGLNTKEAKQRLLYKHMFQIQIREESLAGGFYQLR